MITSCSYEENYNSEFYCKKLNFKCIRENKKILFRTSKGDLEAELFGESNPITVTNFIKNIQKDIYKNKKFYKIVNYPQIQVIHSGIYSKKDYYKNENKNLNKISPSIPLEIKLNKESEPRYKNEIQDPNEVSNLKRTFEKGSLAMVKSGKFYSSSTEFFFVTNKFRELDGRYSVFGKVLKGAEILKKINNRDYIYEILIFD